MASHDIDLSDRQSVQHWCKKLRCTEHQLRDAVNQVGPIPSNIEAYISQRLRSFDHDRLPPGRRPS